MDKKDFEIEYNGRKTACTSFGERFMVQISYKPVYLELHTDSEGIDHWTEQDLQRETPLAQELGQLIRKQFLD